MSAVNDQSLEDRLSAVEDRLAIFTLMASHPPSADTADADYTRSVYAPDAVYDRGPALAGAQGRDDIAAMLLRPEHGEAIRIGLAHFGSLPLVDLQGREAFVTSYLQILAFDRGGEPRDLPNHGASPGYRVHRVVANRWHLVKVDGQWTVKSRTVRPLDGSGEPLALLSQGLAAAVAARSLA